MPFGIGVVRQTFTNGRTSLVLSCRSSWDPFEANACVLVGQPHCTVTVQCASPPETNRIDEIVRDILHDRGLAKLCDAVEGLAWRLISFYQGGVHDGGALNFRTGLDERLGASTISALQLLAP